MTALRDLGLPQFRFFSAFRPVHAVFALLLLLSGFAASAHGQFRDPDVDIEFEQFGLGGAFLPGEYVGMRIRLTNSPAGRLDEVIQAWVQWEVPNADGDIGEYHRLVTLQRGRPISLWLYAPLLPETRGDTVWWVRVFEMRDGQRRGEIGGRRLRPADFNSAPAPFNANLIGVLGQRAMSLDQYAMMRDERPVSAHEITRVVRGIRPDQLPDRWIPLRPYEAIVWGSARDSVPQDLTSDTAGALREYVRNGGHLVIVLPEDANPWQFGTRQTPLHDLLPQREPRKDEAVPVEDLLPIVSKSRELTQRSVRPMAVRVFKEIQSDFDVLDGPYEPLIALRDGRVVVVQRTFGHGRVTISGLDVAQLMPLALPHADVFWNRVLGRRMDSPHERELRILEEARMLVRSPGAATRDVGSGALILQQISMDTAAGLGLMLALLLFAAYWALAGPGGFALLKLYKRTHHAWIAFVGAAGAFTAIAWGIVGLIRVNEPRIEHVTFLDHIARPDGSRGEEDPQLQRAVSWFSLYTPGYTRTRVSIESERGRYNILAPWSPPGESLQRFPNVDRFQVSVADSPADYAIPSRQTTTLMHAHWQGGLDSDWGGMIRSSVDAPVRVVYDGAGQESGLYGRLTHDFARPLTNVTVIWVRNLRLPSRQYQVIDDEERPWVPLLRSGSLLNTGYMWRLGTPWQPGQALDLSGDAFRPIGSAVLSSNIESRFVSDYRTPRIGVAPTTIGWDERRKYMEMLSIFNQLTPPQYFKARAEDREPDNVFFRRSLGRELDLSPWFTRPCLIIMGFLEGSEIPVPVRLGESGNRPVSNGLTMVRWIYPLPLDVDIAFRSGTEEDEWAD